ncbi:phosphatidylglycerophosphatase A [Methylicorpusculum oleiharenae]|uniref:phosphatidylglycerophosphatase A family protein n=1 Tax=Methylicorpusculum oleiharenae TaxID=1338687 RepID=UPI0019CFE27A|nr:phosphatidylglycerophosphatase A [Methylicorpusculum oleiharenae]MCD2452861.1 phosphatidylglycerophosphatase A [Methylicorpusculum oleiharenae]
MINNKKIDFGSICSDINYFLAFGFGSGLSPKAPGTVGTLVAFPLFWLLDATIPSPLIPVIMLVFFLAGISICDKAGKFSGVCDHPGIVWDEIVAMLIILFSIPYSLTTFVLAFLFFRIFDILKPWPILFFDQKLKNGFGVMFDDLLAALYALLCLTVYQQLFSF